MKNLKIISTVMLVVSCLVETTYPIFGVRRREAFRMSQASKNSQKSAYQDAYQDGYEDGYESGKANISASLNPNYADDANVSIQSTSNGSSDLLAKLRTRIQSQQNKSDQSSNQGSPPNKLDELKSKMQSMSGDKEKSSDFKDKLKSSILAKLKSKGAEVKTQSIEPQEIISVTPSIESTGQVISFPSEAPVVEATEEPSVDTETIPVPTNLALEPISTPIISTEAVTLPTQDVSEDISLTTPEELIAPEEETVEVEPTLEPITEEVSTPLINQSSEEILPAPTVIEEEEEDNDVLPATTSIDQFIIEDELDNDDELNDELNSEANMPTTTEEQLITPPVAVELVETPVVEDIVELVETPVAEDIVELVETPVAEDVNINTDNENTEELEIAAVPVTVAEPVATTVQKDEDIDDEDINLEIQDQPEETLAPTVPTEPVEVPMAVTNAEDDSTISDLATGTLDDEQVVIVKVYPVLDALYSAAQSIKAAALDMISYVFKKSKPVTKKVVESLETPEINSEEA